MSRLPLERVEVAALAEYVDHHDWGAAYLDPATGEVYPASDGDVFDADGEVADLDEVDWIAVGGSSSRAAYGDMEAFAAALADRRLAERLERSLEGRGAFRRFRDTMYRDADETTGKAWNAYRRARSEQRALAWLAEHEVVEERELDAASAVLDAAAAAALRQVGVPTSGARLILLNGMPGAGKSSLAARYLAEHPGVLCVEADRLRDWIGGDPDDHAEASRNLSLAMAVAHLESGYDVVVPQLVARVDQVERFEDAARRAGADLVEVVLHGGVVEARVPDAEVERLVGYAEGLAEVVERRPGTHRLAVRTDLDDTYRDLVDLLDPDLPA